MMQRRRDTIACRCAVSVAELGRAHVLPPRGPGSRISTNKTTTVSSAFFLVFFRVQLAAF